MIEKPIIFNYYNYGVPYYGSYHGMRFMIAKNGEKPDFLLLVVTWPEPLCFDATKEEDKVREEFSFSEEGYKQAIEWLNKQHEGYVTK